MKKIAIPALLLTFSMNVFAANQKDYKVTFDFLDFNNISNGTGGSGGGSEPFATEGQTYSSGLSTYDSGDPLASDDSAWIVQNYINEEKTDFNIILNGQNLYSESINIGNLSTMNSKDQITVSYDGKHYTLTRGNLVDDGTLTGDREYKSYEINVSGVVENSDPVSVISFRPSSLSGCKPYKSGESYVRLFVDKKGDLKFYDYTSSAMYKVKNSDGTYHTYKAAGYNGFGLVPEKGEFTTVPIGSASPSPSLTIWDNVNIENNIYEIYNDYNVRKYYSSSTYSYNEYQVCFRLKYTLW